MRTHQKGALVSASRRSKRNTSTVNRLFCCLTVFILTACGAPLPDTDWSIYLGNKNRSSFSPLQQIHRSNVHELERVWVYESGDLQEGASVMYTSPLVIDGRLYGLSPRLSPFAIDASNGRELWHRTDITGNTSSVQKSLLWLDQNDYQQLVHISNSQLLGINPQTGKTSFTVDLTTSKLSDALANNSPGLILDDLIIVGIGKNILATNTNGEIVWKIDTQAQIGGISADGVAVGFIYPQIPPIPPTTKATEKTDTPTLSLPLTLALGRFNGRSVISQTTFGTGASKLLLHLLEIPL